MDDIVSFNVKGSDGACGYLVTQEIYKAADRLGCFLDEELEALTSDRF